MTSGEAEPERRGPDLVELTPFVGRAEERIRLREILETARGGAGGLVMIGGEPGVGKSRLAQEVAREARERGFRVFTGHCYEREGDLPYMPWVEIIEAAARETPPENLRELLADSAAEMARIAPRLRLTLPDIPAPVELPPEQQRRYTFGCLADHVARVARIQPRLYVVEDLHWADESTLLFLSHLAERLASVPALVIGTYRDPPLDVSPILAETLSVLVRTHRARLIGLRRHPESEVWMLLAALGGEQPPLAVVAAIHAATEGNAFFVEEMFRHLTETGALLGRDGHFRADVCVAELDVPHNVRLVTGRRLERLGRTTQQMLTAAAVLGRRCRLDVLARVVDLDETGLLDAVEEAEQARLVATELKAGDVEMWFAHELIRQTLLARLSPARRQRHHLRAATALEQVHVRHPEVGAADIAHHLLQAGPAADARTTATYLRIAGDHALNAAAFEEAIRHFEGALDLLPEESPAERAVLLENSGHALSSLGRSDEALASWRLALDGYRAAGEVGELTRLCGQVAYQLGWMARFTQALELADRELRSFGRLETPDRALLLATAAFGTAHSGDFEAGHRLLVEGMELARKLGDRRSEGTVLAMATNVYWAHSRFPEAVEVGLQVLSMLRETGAEWDCANALWVTQVSLHTLGRWDEAEALGAELERIAPRIGNLGALLVGRRERGARARQRGADLRRYEEFATADLELNQSAGMPWIAHSHVYLALLDFWRGDWDRALPRLRTACELEPRPSPASLWSPAVQLLITSYAGGGDETRAMFEGLEHQLPAPGRAHTLGAWQLVACAVEALAVIGDAARAAGLYPLLVEQIDGGVVVDGYIHGRLLHMLAGIAATAGGDLATAERHFEEALAQARRLDMRMEDPDIRRFYAAMLIERGAAEDRRRGRELLTEAIAAYRAIGMPRHQQLAERLAARIAPHRDPGAASDALSGREWQVLRLVAKGHRNSEIAGQLFLTEATVQRHVSNIYAKLGVRNRAEATAYVLGQGVPDERPV